MEHQDQSIDRSISRTAIIFSNHSEDLIPIWSFRDWNALLSIFLFLHHMSIYRPQLYNNSLILQWSKRGAKLAILRIQSSHKSNSDYFSLSSLVLFSRKWADERVAKWQKRVAKFLGWKRVWLNEPRGGRRIAWNTSLVYIITGYMLQQWTWVAWAARTRRINSLARWVLLGDTSQLEKGRGRSIIPH